ncbi:hypothetical protein JAAARDRAFT_53364 [Jaapia argillacea MUCL 33604]|uniref:Uncharacterized protein n=1 Tax=Jaapia argillacea MUCL 33604 TaxID=933084 RepID=A0A067QHZ3_9AGAM|nr:hypothetical protein JAAARDRAFT_53364 [Jaapia argillacea MUCL 33604]
MAKPSIASPSSSSSNRSTRASKSSAHRHRSPAIYHPSPGVLTFLASLVWSSSTATGRPIPTEPPALRFLYPFDNDSFAILESPPLHRSAESPNLDRRRFDFPNGPRKRTNVADQYEQGPDGRWRRVNEWSLYGSTVRRTPVGTDPTSSDTAVSTTPTSSSAPAYSTSPIPMSDPDILNSLPQGWKPIDSKDRPTAIITVLSLLIAGIIIAIIACAVFWRKKRRLAPTKDPEKHLRRNSGGEVEGLDQENWEEVKRFRSQKKLWARATARWKANARQSARRRRRLGMRSGDHQSVVSVVLNDDAESEAPPSNSAVSSSAPVDLQPTTPTQLVVEDRSNSEVAGPSVSLPAPMPLPPAYPSDTQMHRNNTPPEDTGSSISPPPPIDTKLSSPPPFVENPLPSSHLSASAHVATDDKTVLAHMVSLASAPPTNEDCCQGSSSDVPPLVPPYIDEDFEQLPAEVLGTPPPLASVAGPSTLPPAGRSPFPPPPEKSQHFHHSDCYEYLYESDILGAEAEIEPSAPPFDAYPSDPALEPDDTLPSAPPLQLDDELPLPSAPDLELDGTTEDPRSRRDEEEERQGIGVPVSALEANLPSYSP